VQLDDGSVIDLLNNSIFNGTSASETINVSSINWTSNAVYGGDGNDVITSSSKNDIIQGQAGDDYLNGGRGNDTYIFTKGDGNDNIFDAESDPTGNLDNADKIRIIGYNRDEVIFTRVDYSLKITFKNNPNDSILLAGQFHFAVNHRVELIEFDDPIKNINLTNLTILNGTSASETIQGIDWTANNIFGDEGDDLIIGKNHSDLINGGTGNDNINGGVGNDQLTGGLGYDVLIGGAGNDQFIFNDLLDSTASESDLILDFIKGEDKINLSNLGFDSIAEGQGKNSSAHGIEYYFEDGKTIIDDQNSNFAVKLAGEIRLENNDFIF
jgi:Ca2+-binding RTX toxin-like protein